MKNNKLDNLITAPHSKFTYDNLLTKFELQESMGEMLMQEYKSKRARERWMSGALVILNSFEEICEGPKIA